MAKKTPKYDFDERMHAKHPLSGQNTQQEGVFHGIMPENNGIDIKALWR